MKDYIAVVMLGSMVGVIFTSSLITLIEFVTR